MVESSPSRQRRPPYKTNKGMADEAVDAAALTYVLTYYLLTYLLTLFLEMVLDSSGNGGLSVLARRSCSNVGFLDYHDNSMDHLDDPQCLHVARLEAWGLCRGSSARVRPKALELHSDLAWG